MNVRCLLLLTAAGCAVPDADVVDGGAIRLVGLLASTDELDRRATHVIGTMELDFTSSDELVAVTVQRDGDPVFTGSYRADRLTIPLDVVVAPLAEGANHLVIEARYLDATTAAALTVELPEGLSALLVDPPAQPDVLATTITGSVTLAWDAPAPARLEAWVEGSKVAGVELPGLAGKAAFAVPVPLPHAGPNQVVVVASYGEARRQATVQVGVAEPITGLTFEPAALTSATFDVDVSGELVAGYRSEEAATLEILADGELVHSQLLDVSEVGTVPFQAVVPLSHAGANELVARVGYGGAEASATRTVSVVPPEPAVSGPAPWRLRYVPSERYTATGTLLVTPPAEWALDGVRGSMDGGLTWIAGAPVDGGAEVTFLDPDLQQPVLFEVDVSNRGIPVSWRYAATIPVRPIFRCAAPELSMVPTTDLLQERATEQRLMIGYFGAPGAHSLQFALTSETRRDGPLTQLGTVLQAGAFSADVVFDMDPYRCGGDCAQDYQLEAFVDGASICANPAFGQVLEGD